MADFKTKSGFIIAELSGVAEFTRKLQEIPELLQDGEVRAGYQGAMKGVADAVRKQAPVSKYPYASLLKTRRASSRPGTLRRSIVGKAFTLAAWRRWGPGGFAQVTLRRGAVNRAPHANIIKPGRRALTPKNKSRMVVHGHVRPGFRSQGCGCSAQRLLETRRCRRGVGRHFQGQAVSRTRLESEGR